MRASCRPPALPSTLALANRAQASASKPLKDTGETHCNNQLGGSIEREEKILTQSKL